MRHIKIFENFEKRSYYEFNMSEFVETFQKIFKRERFKQIHNTGYNSDFISNLFKTLPSWTMTSIVENLTIEVSKDVLSYIFQNKEIEFTGESGVLVKFTDIIFGRVKHIVIYPDNTHPIKNILADDFQVQIYLYDNRPTPALSYRVDIEKPIKIYSEKTDLENEVDMLSTIDKYNL